MFSTFPFIKNYHSTCILFGKLALLVLLVCPGAVWAQSIFDPPEKVDSSQPVPVSDSLLRMNTYEADTSVTHFISRKKADVYFEQEGGAIIAQIDYLVRYKVLKEKGKQAALVEIPYFTGQDVEEITHIEGTTYHQDGSRAALDTTSIKNVSLGAQYNLKSFTLPDVRRGDVLEYRYTIRRRFLQQLPDFYVADRVPVEYAEFNVHYPDYLRYKMLPHRVPVSIEIQKLETDTSSVPRVFTYERPEPVVVNRWIVEDIPAVQKRPFLNNINQYRGKLSFLLNEFGKPRQQLENSWQLVAAKMRRQTQWFESTGGSDRLDRAWRQLQSGLPDSVLSHKQYLQDAVFDYVNRQMTHNGSDGTLPGDSVATVLGGQPAGQPSINYVLLQLLRRAGIEAYPLFMASRESDGLNRDLPSRYQFSSTLIYSEIDGKPYFMDAAYELSYPNLIWPKHNVEQGFVLMPKGRGYRWVEVEPEQSRFVLNTGMQADIKRNGDLEGSLEATQKGYPARKIRKWQVEKKPASEIAKDALFPGYADIEVNNVTIRDHKDRQVTLQADFSVPGYGSSFQSGISFRPMVIGGQFENPLEAEERSIPVVLEAPEELNLNFQISYPDNWSYDSLKSSRQYSLAGADLIENYENDRANNTLNYRFSIFISRYRFEQESYYQLRRLYSRWVSLTRDRWFLSEP